MKKRIFSAIVLSIVLLIGQIIPVMGAEAEWYELHEIPVEEGEQAEKTVLDEAVPYTRYIMGTTVTLLQGDSKELLMRSEVFCTDTMSTITTSFTLQKKSGSKWITVGTGSVSVNNSDHMYKGMSASGVSSGTYRCVADTRVTNSTGYSETVSVTSGQVSI